MWELETGLYRFCILGTHEEPRGLCVDSTYIEWSTSTDLRFCVVLRGHLYLISNRLEFSTSLSILSIIMSSSDDAETGGSEVDQEITKVQEVWEAEVLHLTAPSRMVIKFHENDGDFTMVEQPQAKLLWLCDRFATVFIPVAIAQMLGVVGRGCLTRPEAGDSTPCMLTHTIHGRPTAAKDGAMVVKILTDMD
eukprot:gene8374-17265_t